MSGKLYGVGIGPGDPELLTLKAVRVIKEAAIIAVAGTKKEDTTAYRIVEQTIPEIHQKECLEIEMPMTKDAVILEKSHQQAAEKVAERLKQGEDVAFLILGDPTIYSTYMYVHKRIAAEGFDTEIINGITSFCAAAARLNMGLVEKEQMLHIIPSSYSIEEALTYPGVKVLMKSGKQMPKVKEQLMQLDGQVDMVENCGMKNEKIYHGAAEIPEHAGYYSLVIVK